MDEGSGTGDWRRYPGSTRSGLEWPPPRFDPNLEGDRRSWRRLESRCPRSSGTFTGGPGTRLGPSCPGTPGVLDPHLPSPTVNAHLVRRERPKPRRTGPVSNDRSSVTGDLRRGSSWGFWCRTVLENGNNRTCFLLELKETTLYPVTDGESFPKTIVTTNPSKLTEGPVPRVMDSSNRTRGGRRDGRNGSDAETGERRR